MALETLKDVTHINSFPIFHVKEITDAVSYAGHHLVVDHIHNALMVRIQSGPIKENGVNGVQIDDLIQICFTMIAGLNEQFPCQQNIDAMISLEMAMKHLGDRKLDRVKRDVEGTNQA